MSFGIPVRNGLSVSLVSSTFLSSGRRLNPALNLDFLTGGPLDPRITFSRTSQATLVDSTGKLTYAPNNLLTNSEAFEASAWAKTNTAVTANATAAPDGTTTADKLINSNGVAGYVGQSLTIPAGSTFLSIYAKKGEWNWVVLGRGGANAFFNLNTGTIGTVSGGYTASIQSIGNGWYRCAMLWADNGSVTTARVYPTNADNSFTNGDGTSGIFIWGAQLEQVTYQTTPGTYNSTSPKNLLGYTQEFDNAAWTKSNSFIQTNLLTYSEDFTNAAWAKTDITATANAIAAPNGTLTADLLTEGSAGSAFLANAVTTVASATYTYSIYVKRGNTDWLRLTCSDGTNNYIIWVNTATGAIGNNSTAGIGVYTSSSITAVGDGWYRVALTGSVPLTTTSCRVNSATANGSNTRVSGATYYLWGAQLVQGSTAGDYQRTDAAAAAVQYVAPDGSRTADKLVEDTANSQHAVVVATGSRPTIAAGLFVHSVYVKAAERSSISLYNNGTSGGAGVVFNLSNGTVGASGGTQYSSSSITSVGNGWYRCSLTFTSLGGTSGLTVYLGTAFSGEVYTGDGTSGIYIWGAQLANSASLDPYVYNPVAAPTSAAYYGPRFDYDPVTLANKGLLIEEQRTNLLLQSQLIGSTSWNASGVTATTNSILAPDGTTTATLVTENTANASHALYGTNATFPAGNCTLSAYIKGGTRRYVSLRGESIATTTYAWITFDTQTGSINAAASVISSSAVAVGNGWWRVSMTWANNTTGAGIANIVFAGSDVATAPATSSTLGNVYTGTSSTFYVWGAQVEAGSFATSYIPTVASQVTRTADVALMQGANFSNWYNQNEGTFVVGAEFPQSNGAETLCVDDGSSANALEIYRSSSTKLNGYVRSGNVTVADMACSQNLTAGTSYATAIAYAADNFAFNVAGVAPTTDTAGAVPVGVNIMRIGSYRGGGNQVNGHIRRIGYYNTRLPNTALVSLTAPNIIPSLSLDFTTQVFNVG